jgi:dimethylargininase
VSRGTAVAIVRPPGRSFPAGITGAGLGRPNVERALEQHDVYVRELEQAGMAIIRLPSDERHPDSTFIEDTAVIVGDLAVLARSGAPSRQGEVQSTREELSRHFAVVHAIRAPGTLDGGDVCETGTDVFIGISRRTNEKGARQLAELLATRGIGVVLVDISCDSAALHLKSGLAYLGGSRLAVIEPWRNRPEFAGYEIITVASGESAAANALHVNGRTLIASGFPAFEEELRRRGDTVVPLDVSEFRKMDGGLSCLSLRFTRPGPRGGSRTPS